MTNFEKMKYLHRNKKQRSAAGAVKKNAKKKGTAYEERSGDPPENIPG